MAKSFVPTVHRIVRSLHLSITRLLMVKGDQRPGFPGETARTSPIASSASINTGLFLSSWMLVYATSAFCLNHDASLGAERDERQAAPALIVLQPQPGAMQVTAQRTTAR